MNAIDVERQVVGECLFIDRGVIEYFRQGPWKKFGVHMMVLTFVVALWFPV